MKDISENIIKSNILDSIALSHTSKGVLFKWTTIIEETKYYYKSGKLSYGIFKELEPINECIACSIFLKKILKILFVDMKNI